MLIMGCLASLHPSYSFEFELSGSVRCVTLSICSQIKTITSNDFFCYVKYDGRLCVPCVSRSRSGLFLSSRYVGVESPTLIDCDFRSCCQMWAHSHPCAKVRRCLTTSNFLNGNRQSTILSYLSLFPTVIYWHWIKPQSIGSPVLHIIPPQSLQPRTSKIWLTLTWQEILGLIPFSVTVTYQMDDLEL